MTATSKKLPRYWKTTIAKLTGLRFCDRHCDCGENNGLWWFPSMTLPSDHSPNWLPGWMNGAYTDEIWQWLDENGKT